MRISFPQIFYSRGVGILEMRRKEEWGGGGGRREENWVFTLQHFQIFFRMPVGDELNED